MSDYGNILLLVDDPQELSELEGAIASLGFDIYTSKTPTKVRGIFYERDYKLVIIHFRNQPLKGLEICAWIRSESTTPILMITARNEVVDEQMAIRAGANDYIVKPIERRILLARINQQVQRNDSHLKHPHDCVKVGNFEIDLARHEFLVDGKEVPLTNHEYRLMNLLMDNADAVVSRDEIIEIFGGASPIGSDHLIDTHVYRLRKKFAMHGIENSIDTVRGVGLKLKDSLLA